MIVRYPYHPNPNLAAGYLICEVGHDGSGCRFFLEIIHMNQTGRLKHNLIFNVNNMLNI